MADMQSIILHNYDWSPFSEKIKLALRLKNVPWTSVDVSPIMPRPDLIPLTGGYRRIPVMQIGADIYCDTQVILRELEHRFPETPLNNPRYEGLANMVSVWSDTKWFMTSVQLVFGLAGDQYPKEFHDDRAKLMGDHFDTEAMKVSAPFMRDQWRSQLMWIEERLIAGQKTGDGDWLSGQAPGLVDIHAYMNPWLINLSIPDYFTECLNNTSLTANWFEQLKAIDSSVSEEIDGVRALEIATAVKPMPERPSTADDVSGFQPGEQVAVAPDDYGIKWVQGELILADRMRVIISIEDEQVGSLHLHFPRVGYCLRKA